MEDLVPGRIVLLVTMSLIVSVLPFRFARAYQPSSLADLTARGISRLEGSVLKELRGVLDRSGQDKLKDYQGQLSELAGLIRRNPDELGERSEAFEDLRQELHESYLLIQNDLDDPRVEVVESRGDLHEDSLDDPEDFSDDELLDQWFGTMNQNESTQRLLEANRSMLKLIDVYGAYTVRSDSVYRSQLLTRYLDLVFPSVIQGYLAEPGSEPIAGFLYRGSLNLLDRQLDRPGRSPGSVRHVTALLRFQGRILREVARGTPRSDQLESTLATIRRLGRSYTGGTTEDEDGGVLD